jgi:hypothetical protein
MSKSRKPIGKEDIRQNPDPKIDQDFEGYPSGPAKDGLIRPDSNTENEISDVNNKDGEKRIYRKDDTDDQDSDGSASAFEDK